MRVALDATPLSLSSGGLRRYTEELSRALAAEFPRDVFTLISDQDFDLPLASPNLRQGPLPHTRIECRWWTVGASIAMRRLHAEVFHGVNFEVPYLNLRPSVLTLHDLSPWKNSAWHTDAERVRSRAPWLLRLGIATMAITPSEAIRREAIDFFGIAPDRIVAVPLAPFALTSPSSAHSSDAPYFLFVGTLEPRKNLELLVEAWRAVRVSHAIDLVLAGRRRTDGPTFPNEPGLRILGEVSDDQLAVLYAQAIALVYPSHYEGFGLPVLEAMQAGAAVIVSNDPALLEVGGDAALRAGSARDLAQAMLALITQPDLRAQHREKSLRRAAQFSWRETARQTHAVYREATARFG